ncbi:Protein FAM151B, partial [Corvus brachyrhynchos]
PILAHPPDTDSDITLQEWLAEMVSTNKGIKLDFKRLNLFIVAGSVCVLLGREGEKRAVGICLGLFLVSFDSVRSAEAHMLAQAITGFSPRQLELIPTPVLSPGYAWPMVQEMSRLCQPLSQPVTFAVRAALVPSSVPQLQWLMQQSHRYSLTVWTGKEDMYSVEDLLFIRENFDKSRVYYDIFEPQNSEFKKAIGI